MTKHWWALLAILTALVALACLGCPPRPVGPPDSQDGGPLLDPLDAAATCGTACEHWRELGCPEGSGSPRATCEEVCDNIQRSGILAWDLDCRSRITSCSQLDQCED